MDIIVMYLDRKTCLGPPEAVKHIDRPPYADTVLSFNLMQGLTLRNIVIQPEAEAVTESIANEDICRVKPVQKLTKVCLRDD